MIEPKDIRIGNLVDLYGHPLKVSTFSPDYCNFEKFSGTADFEDIKPIPLTEEWLIKFGFEKGKYHTYKLYYGGGTKENGKHLTYVCESGNIELCRGHLTTADAAVHFVHQLQNLYFSLTGKELTVK